MRTAAFPSFLSSAPAHFDDSPGRYGAVRGKWSYQRWPTDPTRTSVASVYLSFLWVRDRFAAFLPFRRAVLISK